MISVFEFDDQGFYTLSYRVWNADEICVDNYLTDNPHVFRKAKVNDINNPTHWVEGFSQDEMDEEERQINIERTKMKYELHRNNGWNAYQDFRADIVENIANELLTENQAFIIEKYLSIGYDKIAQNGDWKTGLYELNQLEIPEENIFVLPYKTVAIQIIQTYIQNNYDS